MRSFILSSACLAAVINAQNHIVNVDAQVFAEMSSEERTKFVHSNYAHVCPTFLKKGLKQSPTTMVNGNWLGSGVQCLEYCLGEGDYDFWHTKRVGACVRQGKSDVCDFECGCTSGKIASAVADFNIGVTITKTEIQDCYTGVKESARKAALMVAQKFALSQRFPNVASRGWMDFGNFWGPAGWADEMLRQLAINGDWVWALDAGRNGFEPDFAKKLIRVLPKTNINQLNLNINSIGDKGAIALAKKLPKSKIDTYILYGNGITNKGAKAFYKALKNLKDGQMHPLKDLDLRFQVGSSRAGEPSISVKWQKKLTAEFAKAAERKACECSKMQMAQ